MLIVLCESPFCQNLDGRDLWHTLQKFLFLHDYWTKSEGVFGKMQIISYSFIILKHIEIDSQSESYWCWKSDCNLFGGTNGIWQAYFTSWKLFLFNFNSAICRLGKKLKIIIKWHQCCTTKGVLADCFMHDPTAHAAFRAFVHDFCRTTLRAINLF